MLLCAVLATDEVNQVRILIALEENDWILRVDSLGTCCIP